MKSFDFSSIGNYGVGHYLSGRKPEGSMGRVADHIFMVDEDRCFGCAACVALCPVDALHLEGVMVYVDEPGCTHCELCIPACPVFALDIMRESRVIV